MNATCSAGILLPQRVSDLGRLLNSEITAPLDSTARGVCNTSMAPAHLQGALSNICMAPVHLQGALTSPCARQFFIPTRGSVCPPTSKGGNFLTKWRFQRNVAFSHLASRDARRRALRVGTTQEEFSFDIQQQVLLPALPIFHYHSRHDIQHSRAIGDHERRANETAQHDETSRARRQDPRTVTAKAQRTALLSTYVCSGATANGRFQNPNRRF